MMLKFVGVLALLGTLSIVRLTPSESKAVVVGRMEDTLPLSAPIYPSDSRGPSEPDAVASAGMAEDVHSDFFAWLAAARLLPMAYDIRPTWLTEGISRICSKLGSTGRVKVLQIDKPSPVSLTAPAQTIPDRLGEIPRAGFNLF